ncbi:PREDICTED: D-aspartate oxidase-like [Amphimedon queenslandica]|uniref:FAD dependent oxidoreductase domain-containing protein n=1 Tax=Amphimedon queenslandica TaxID=400682 RepID=A0A1X7UYN6_AMPQE|nr:PREDICTED: D-aspartate oxidase-like [Amphimedon queenslandica]|eukprot:XP_019851505.1 PREDICTED: D-aspartate oxidase-like [Amphimedon queenslandica]
MARVAVIGAGFIGSSVSLHLLQEHGKSVQLTLISESFSPDTTSDKSTALMLPFDVIPPSGGDGIVEGVGDPEEWLKDTISHIRGLHDSPEGGLMGISLIHGVRALAEQPTTGSLPWWHEHAYGYRTLSTDEVKSYNIPSGYPWAESFSTYVVDSRLYLPQLLSKIKALGGNTLHSKIESISELTSKYDIIINCSGLGSAVLASDSTVYPVRGDIVSVHAPWIKEFTILESPTSITSVIPRPNDVLLGVTAIPHEHSTEPSEETNQLLIRNGTALVPSLKTAKVLTSWAGLRPMRSKVRLCIDSSYKESVVVHCYGHGSKGGCFHWGCAVQVGKLLHSAIIEKSNSN